MHFTLCFVTSFSLSSQFEGHKEITTVFTVYHCHAGQRQRLRKRSRSDTCLPVCHCVLQQRQNDSEKHSVQDSVELEHTKRRQQRPESEEDASEGD